MKLKLISIQEFNGSHFELFKLGSIC